jgi:hypothetical protein
MMKPVDARKALLTDSARSSGLKILASLQM